MLKYIIILLDDTSVSFCHYDNSVKISKSISVDNLKEGIFFAMKENLNIQFVYPDKELPDTIYDIIDTVDHVNIVPSNLCVDTDVIVYEEWDDLAQCQVNSETNYVIRTSMAGLIEKREEVLRIISLGARLNVVITNIEKQEDRNFKAYKLFLDKLVNDMVKLYSNGLSPQLNLLTDRLVLDGMNNCNAGWESITLAPDGKFYVCPAFYYEQDYSIGSLAEGLDIKNPQLYRLDHAPICRHCDAYQCRRCIWLNKKTTLEVNTPSHEQCVVAHLERNASRELLRRGRELGEFLPEKEIKEIDYLDPFDKRKEWQ